MKINKNLVVFLLIFTKVIALFKSQCDNKFQLKESKIPKNILMSPDKTQIIAWDNDINFYIYDTTGNRVCNASLPGRLQKISWIEGQNPFAMIFPSRWLLQIYPINCTFRLQYNLTQPLFKDFSVIKRKGALKNVIAMQSIQQQKQDYYLVTATGQNDYEKGKPETSFASTLQTRNYFESVYSAKLQFLYVSQITFTGSRQIQIFNCSIPLSSSMKTIPLNLSITNLFAGPDETFIIALGWKVGTTTNVILKISNSGEIKTLAERQMINQITYSPENSVIVLIKGMSNQMEVIDSEGNSLQNLAYFDKSSDPVIFDCKIRQDKLIAVDNEGNVIISTFIPDKKGDVVDPFPIWIIIVSSFAGLIVVTAIILCVCRKKLFKKKSKDILLDKEGPSILSDPQSVYRGESQYNPPLQNDDDIRIPGYVPNIDIKNNAIQDDDVILLYKQQIDQLEGEEKKQKMKQLRAIINQKRRERNQQIIEEQQLIAMFQKMKEQQEKERFKREAENEIEQKRRRQNMEQQRKFEELNRQKQRQRQAYLQIKLREEQQRRKDQKRNEWDKPEEQIPRQVFRQKQHVKYKPLNFEDNLKDGQKQSEYPRQYAKRMIEQTNEQVNRKQQRQQTEYEDQRNLMQKNEYKSNSGTYNRDNQYD